MTTGIQGSLFADAPALGSDSGLRSLTMSLTRRGLSGDAWVDVRPGWITGADSLFDELRGSVPWRAERRRMYDRVVDVPRLVAHYQHDERLPHPFLDEAIGALSAHYRDELGEDFATAGLALYRDGSDSVAWHGDRFGKGATHDTMVAIVSLGAPRHLLLRPAGGGASLKFTLTSGDLLVMGGSCQRTWEHAVPKSPGAGPRMSIQFRSLGVW